MDATTLVSVEQYLSSVYEPDCDYVDGEIEDRNFGEKDHSKLQFRVQMLLSRIPGIAIFPEVRIRVAPTRYRVPDVSVYLTEPSEQVFTTPPFLIVEILSPEDRWSRLTRKLEDYFAMGCPNIWILDPVRSKAYRYEGEAVCEVHDAFRTTDSRVILQLADIWPR
jgi:Uma2 family endonuclease